MAINQHKANIISLNESNWNSKCWASRKSRKKWSHLLWPATPQKAITVFCSLNFLLAKICQFTLFYCEPSGKILETRIICGPLVFIYIKKYKPGFGEGYCSLPSLGYVYSNMSEIWLLRIWGSEGKCHMGSNRVVQKSRVSDLFIPKNCNI